jgi:Ni/Fe-hydrogenase subunit HybB-like protein
MLGCRDPSSSQNGLTSQSPSPRTTFSSKITLTTMLWSYLVSSRDFWSIMFWLIQVVQRISYLLRPSDRYKSQKTRFMMLHTLFVASEEDRL